MLTGWNVAGDVRFQKIGIDRILVQFGNSVEKDRVMARGPWSFDKNLVVLRKLVEDEDPNQVCLDECYFYIHTIGLPMLLMHRGIAELLGNAMGSFQGFDSSHSKGFSGGAFRVRIDIMKPLRRMIQISCPNGQDIQVRVAYERLPNFCCFCGVIGHLVKDCTNCLHVTNSFGDVPEDRLEYGDWMRTNANAKESRIVYGSLHRHIYRPPRQSHAIRHSGPATPWVEQERSPNTEGASGSSTLGKDDKTYRDVDAVSMEVNAVGFGKDKGKKILVENESGEDIDCMDLALTVTPQTEVPVHTPFHLNSSLSSLFNTHNATCSNHETMSIDHTAIPNYTSQPQHIHIHPDQSQAHMVVYLVL